MSGSGNAKFIPNPALGRQLQASAPMSAAVRQVAQRVADDAEGRADSKYGYKVNVDVSGGEAKLKASTTGGQGVQNLAGWIEFGARNIPAQSPLRRAADANGLKVVG